MCDIMQERDFLPLPTHIPAHIPANETAQHRREVTFTLRATMLGAKDFRSQAACSYYAEARGCFHSNCPAHRPENYALNGSRHAADTVLISTVTARFNVIGWGE